MSWNCCSDSLGTGRETFTEGKGGRGFLTSSHMSILPSSATRATVLASWADTSSSAKSGKVSNTVCPGLTDACLLVVEEFRVLLVQLFVRGNLLFAALRISSVAFAHVVCVPKEGVVSGDGDCRVISRFKLSAAFITMRIWVRKAVLLTRERDGNVEKPGSLGA